MYEWLDAGLKVVSIFLDISKALDKVRDKGAQNPKAASGGNLLKKVLLNFFQNSQENTCSRVSFLIKLQESCTDLSLWYLRNFLQNTFFTEQLPATASENQISGNLLKL